VDVRDRVTSKTTRDMTGRPSRGYLVIHEAPGV